MAQRKEYTKELEELHESMIRLGSRVETALDLAAQAVKTCDEKICKQVIEGDDEIDLLCEEIDRNCVLLIARQQPVASDLRDITSDLKLVADLERMADHAEDICEHVLHIRESQQRVPDHAEDICEHVLHIRESQQRVPAPARLLQMFQACKNMTARSLDAYVTRSREQALKVLSMDEEVDELYHELRREIPELMREQPELIDSYIEWLMIAKHIERFADHAENVAEWVIYYLDGKFDIHG